MGSIQLIKSEEDYDRALLQLESLFHAKPNTPEGDRLEVLSLLVHDYESRNYKVEAVTPLEALKIEMEEQGLNQKSLAERFGMSKSTVSEILSGRKQMSLRFLRFLHHELGIPAEILLA